MWAYYRFDLEEIFKELAVVNYILTHEEDAKERKKSIDIKTNEMTREIAKETKIITNYFKALSKKSHQLSKLLELGKKNPTILDAIVGNAGPRIRDNALMRQIGQPVDEQNENDPSEIAFSAEISDEHIGIVTNKEILEITINRIDALERRSNIIIDKLKKNGAKNIYEALDAATPLEALIEQCYRVILYMFGTKGETWITPSSPDPNNYDMSYLDGAEDEKIFGSSLFGIFVIKMASYATGTGAPPLGKTLDRVITILRPVLEGQRKTKCLPKPCFEHLAISKPLANRTRPPSGKRSQPR